MPSLTFIPCLQCLSPKHNSVGGCRRMASPVQDTDTKRTGDLPYNVPMSSPLQQDVPIIWKMTSLTFCGHSSQKYHMLIGAVFNCSYGDGSCYSGRNRSHLQPARLCICGNLCSEHSCLLASHQTPQGQDRCAAV